MSQQIDQTSYYLSSLFWLIKTAARGYDLLDIQTNTKLFEFDEFRLSIQNISEIGEALSDQLTLYSCSIPSFDETDKNDAPTTKTEPEEPAEEFDDGTIESANEEKLAAVVAAVLQNPNLPEPMYEAIKNGINDVFNSPRMNQQKFIEYEETPEYIAKVFSSYALKEDA